MTYKDGHGSTRARGLGAPKAVFSPGAQETARSAMRSGTEKTPKLRGRECAKYTCDASARMANVHAKHNKMRRDGICRNVRRARVKKVINGLRGQKAK
eukprot:3560631-Pleurochrysis_carterae.AAC.1